MRTGFLLLAAALAVAVPAPAAAAAQDECAAPANLNLRIKAHYDFTMIYKSQCAEQKNWGREFPDLTADNGAVSVTTSTALAGSIASVRWGGREFIGSGGHGAAFQWALRPLVTRLQDPTGKPGPTECFNPTQAGSQDDDRETNAPFHGDSTSYLHDPKLTGATFSSVNRMANYVPYGQEGHPNPGETANCKATDYQRNVSPFSDGLSQYVLWSQIALAPDHDLPLPNVFRVRGDIVSEDSPRTVASTLVAYTLKEFSAQYRYNLDAKQLTEFGHDEGGQADPVLRCTETGSHCMAFYLQRSRFPFQAPAGAPMNNTYFWAHSEAPRAYNAWGGAYTMEVTNYTDNFRGLNAEVYVAVGDQDLVLKTLDKLRELKP
ncbi:MULTISPECIES: hypothetical protein [unclassified Crossiella]|uniref:hypothetical protein n=1 Tax=unclassified Crossiella TaxID=2620835 RepID=UPI001FFF0755|nr:MULTISPECIES: hypothetical protein [unclassified Crossiella]MCK2238364.1 hypothetical protein [Crossiella sp. S99.2]MCK2256404.1 hypothetical protein [Crossiella sp. S99.1]